MAIAVNILTPESDPFLYGSREATTLNALHLIIGNFNQGNPPALANQKKVYHNLIDGVDWAAPGKLPRANAS
ncbi:MAG: hypothetical protein C5B58_08345 [Acidobacteria bacterium]|nr:MAG: hypothetical protein C5B58_08345 [Acidobacteriota bacterium]